METAATISSDDNDDSFRFVVTGFGPFNGIPTNPTSILAEELLAHLQQSTQESNDPVLSVLAKCTETKIVETSAQAVRQEMKLMQQELQRYKSVIILHLGVDGSGTRFKLEKCAYNDASFRVPDEQGYRPTATPVVDTCSLGSTLTASFDVPVLVKHMNTTLATTNGTEPEEANASDQHPPLADVSTDPGRFVCNYIYCSSLDAFACAKTIDDGVASTTEASSSPRVQSLFLHVPPFSRIPKERQLVFVTQLMSALYQQKKSAAES
eukprot:scaffold1060_cov196-Amphora_coffeaeformis.AAC.39